MDIDKIRSLMNFAIEAIGRGQFDLDSWVHDRDDFGREFRLRAGLEAGAQHLHDEFVDSQREFVREAYRALGAKPQSWIKSEVCADLLARLSRKPGHKTESHRTRP